MNTPNSFVEFLKTKGFRLTPQRLAIIDILQNAEKHLAPQEVYEMAREKVPGVTEPTVYRTLAFLTNEGILLCTHNGGGNLLYEIAGNLHHHLVCRACNLSIEIEHDALETLYTDLKRKTGYALDERHVSLFGLCPTCQ